MLRVTGLIAGINGQDDVVYDNEYVKLETIAKQIGHPIPQSHQYFTLSNGQKHVNRVTRHQHRSEGMRVMARQEMNIRGNHVVIEYLEGTKKKREGAVTIEEAYPRKIVVSERSLLGAVSTKTEWDKEKAFYLSLIPSCSSSPYHVSSKDVARYRLHDPRVAANAQLKETMKRWDAIKKIQDDGLSEIRMMIIAAGMGLATKGLDISQVKASLMVRAEQNPTKFADEFYSVSVMALGLVNMCRQYNIVKFIGKSGQFYLAVDETLARLTGNSGIEILKEGYGTQRLGISALADATAQNPQVFKMLGDMLDKAMKDGRSGDAKNSAQIAIAEAKIDDLFASIGSDNLNALAGAGEESTPPPAPPANNINQEAARSADATPADVSGESGSGTPPPVINE